VGDLQEHTPLRWRTSTASGGGNCVEVAMCADVVHIRDSKDPSGPVLSLSQSAWTMFCQRVVMGDF
jgi:hypothetical protein